MSREHPGSGRISTPRCVAVWTAVTAALTLSGRAAPDALVRAVGGEEGFVPLLVDSATVVLALALAWLWVVTSHTVVGLLRGRADELPAGLVRRLVLAACGAAVVVGATTTTAHAADPGPHAGSSQVRLDGLPLPERTTDVGPRERSAAQESAGRHVRVPARSSTPRPSTAPRAVAPVPGAADPEEVAPAPRPSPSAGERAPGRTADAPRVTVRPGDSLWAIASEHLPHGADEDVVDREWRALWEANRGTVGDDPDLIHPGQRLTLPGTESTEEQP